VTVTEAGPRALPTNPAALAQKVSQQLRTHRAGDRPVVLVRAAPVWPHQPDLTTTDGTRLRVVPCVSPLAVWEQLAQERDTALVLLTDMTERELGPGILTEVFRQHVIEVEPWDLVADAFGAQRLDPRLLSERWVIEALLDAMPPEGWPRLAGTVLSRDHALRHLAAVRLGLDRLGLSAVDLDGPALLRWSALPAAVEAFDRLASAERDGLTTWLAAEFGRPARVLVTLLGAGRAADALPLGLVCAAVWSAEDPDALRAQGRIEQYAGNGQLDADSVRGYAAAATAVVESLLQAGDGTPDRRTAVAVLDRAEELLVQFGATSAVRRSTTLRAGYEHRADRVAATLLAALADPAPSRLGAAGAAVDELAAHHLATGQAHRVERARMALRLVRWLGTPGDGPTSVADAVARQVNEWGWVDRALAHAWTGEDVNPRLKQALRDCYQRGQQRRRQLDRAFAERLAAWTAAPTPPGGMLTVEHLLDRVVAPVIRHSDRGVLLVVLDGMSAAVAADLAEDLTRQHWVEHDPLAGNGDSRRRGALAALPSVTDVSRATLFAGALRRGRAPDERAAFESHPLWRGRPARLFHRGLISGGAGEVLDQELEDALSDNETVVAVVINTIDDALYHGRESTDPGWRVAQVGPLRTLLDHARYHGRAVILTSDHGHVIERDGTLLPVDGAVTARHRTDPAPPGDGEVELVGPRVAADGQRIVALWDPALRYLSRRAGYHGGASLAEMTIPVMAFLRLGAAAPKGWAPLLAAPQPAWWSAPDTPPPAAEPEPAAPIRPPRGRKPPAAPAGEALFELPSPPETPSLVAAVLGSEMFAAQHALTPRKVPLAKIRGALAALVDANGVLPLVVVAERAGERPERANGFLTTLQRVFNVDNYPVLSLADEGRTVRLELSLLREQFGVPRGGR
jgi:hypothetical protein